MVRAAAADPRAPEVIAVSFEAAEQLVKVSLPGRLLTDPSRDAYQRFGLGRAHGRSLWTLQLVRDYWRGLRHGTRPRAPEGDIEQLGGDVVIDGGGVIRLVHRSRTPSDRPAVASLLAALNGEPGAGAGAA